MKRLYVIMILASVFLFPITGMAKNYKVSKGECLGVISNSTGVPIKFIAFENSIKNPNLIFVDQILKIPTWTEIWHWKNHGTMPFDKSFILSQERTIVGINALWLMPDRVKKLFIQLIKNQDPVSTVIKVGDRLVEMLSGKGVKRNVVTVTKNEEAKVWRLEFEGRIFSLYNPLVCHNLCWRAENKPSLTLPQKSAKQVIVKSLTKKPEPIVLISENATGTELEISVKEDKSSRSFNDQFEAIAFAGKYFGAENGLGINTDVEGEYAGIKIRYFFLEYKPEEDGTVYNVGIYGGYSEGRGKEFAYRYEWDQLELGFATKANSSDWDFGLDLGFAWRRTWGWEDLYSSYQTDDALALSTYYNNEARRNSGEKLFPEYAFELNGLWAIDPEHQHNWNGYELDSNPSDISWVQLNYRQSLWDFHPEDSNSRITPHWNTAVGYGWSDETPYLQLGFGLKWNWHGYDIVTFNPMNFKWKEGGGNDGWDNFICVDLVGIYRAHKDSQIKVETSVEYLPISGSVPTEEESKEKFAVLVERN